MVYCRSSAGETPLHIVSMKSCAGLGLTGLGNSLIVSNLPANYTPRMLLKLFQSRYCKFCVLQFSENGLRRGIVFWINIVMKYVLHIQGPVRVFIWRRASPLGEASPSKRAGFHLAFTLEKPALLPRACSLCRVTRLNYIYFPTKPGIRYLRSFHFITYP